MLTVLPASDPLCTVSTDDRKLTEINVFPNPATFTISISSNIDFAALEVFDSKGSLVINEMNSDGSNIVIDVSGLVTGMYIVVLRSENGQTISKRFAKE